MINITEQLNYLAKRAPTHLELYADGACKGNPGPGGWGLHFHEFDYPGMCGGDILTTNNIQDACHAGRSSGRRTPGVYGEYLHGFQPRL